MKKTIVDYKLNNKKIIIRCDLNVPIENNVITDDTRIKESLKTIQHAIDSNAKVIILSHLGRVKTEEDKKTNSLNLVSIKLSELLNQEVKFIPYTRGKEVEDAIKNMKNQDVILLENTRFEDVDNKKESNNDVELAKYWASLGDIFINDAFGTCHRSHASNVGIASFLPSGIGFLVKKEIEFLGEAIQKPKRPFAIIMGGKKVSDKIKIIENAVNIADYVLIAGGMSYSFLKALGYNIGTSIVDEESLEFCKKIYYENKDKIILAEDIVTAKYFANEAEKKLVDFDKIEDNYMGLDIGPMTIRKFTSILVNCKTIIWNGPVGVFEFENFSNGTKKICEILSKINSKVIIGGGDSAAAVKKFGYKDKFSHISTGGGASLEMLEGKELPGIKSISD